MVEEPVTSRNIMNTTLKNKKVIWFFQLEAEATAKWSSKGPKRMADCRLSSERPDKQRSVQDSKPLVESVRRDAS